ncbi:unnamed protein product [Rhizophagus irregularis]|nr:unnamed protein product [Rhizophagus irregularis]
MVSFHGLPTYKTVYPDIDFLKMVDGFMSRHNLVNRRKTSVAQRLPENYIGNKKRIKIIKKKKKDDISIQRLYYNVTPERFIGSNPTSMAKSSYYC